jgi:DUF3060 family protein
VDSNGAMLLVGGTSNTVNAPGTCWAVTMMGSGNAVVADAAVHDITVYGWDEAVNHKGGQPFGRDRGRELGMSTASIMPRRERLRHRPQYTDDESRRNARAQI